MEHTEYASETVERLGRCFDQSTNGDACGTCGLCRAWRRLRTLGPNAVVSVAVIAAEGTADADWAKLMDDHDLMADQDLGPDPFNMGLPEVLVWGPMRQMVLWLVAYNHGSGDETWVAETIADRLTEEKQS